MRHKGEARLASRLAVVETGRNICFMGGGSPDTSGQNEAARMNAEIAKEMWGNYKTTYLPKEQQFVSEAFNYDTPEKRAQQAGLASADVNQAFGRAAQANERQMAGMGVDPNSVKFQAGLDTLSLKKSAADAGAQNTARLGVENMGWAHKQDALALGKGLPGTASASMAASGATYGSLANTQMQNEQNNNASIGSTVRGGIDTASLINSWGKKDGGLVTKPRHLAAGGIVSGNPAMEKVLANNAASASTPVAAGPDPTGEAIKDAKTVKKGYNLYQELSAPAKTGMAAMDQAAPVMSEAYLAGQAGATGMAALDGAAPVMAAEYAAPVIAGEAAAGTAAAGTGATAGLAAGLAAVPVAGWIALAGLAASQLKDGGKVGRKDIRKGGAVNGAGTETSDSIPAQLSDGEYVMNAESVKMIGKKKLDKMNAAGLAKRYGTKGRAA